MWIMISVENIIILELIGVMSCELCRIVIIVPNVNKHVPDVDINISVCGLRSPWTEFKMYIRIEWERHQLLPIRS